MKMEDKLIEEYRSRSVEYRLPLPEDGWERLEAAFAPAPAEVRRFPYRWLAAAVSFLAVLGSALYFMGIDKEIEPVLSDIVLPAEKVDSLAYNYGKNFIIFDFTPEFCTGEIGEWAAHVIENGRLKASFYRKDADDEFEKMLKKSTKNIGYYGDDNFKFKTLENVNQYAKEANALRCQIADMYKPADAIMREWSKTFHESKNLEKGSEEYAVFQKKVQDYIKRHDEELAKIKPIISKLKKDFADKWIEKDSEEYLKMSDFGESVEAGILTLKCRKKQEKESAEKIEEAKKHGIFFDRQKEWQYYCKYFKKTYGKMLEKEGEEFWEKYFEWCEITDEEREKVEELRKEMGI